MFNVVTAAVGWTKRAAVFAGAGLAVLGAASAAAASPGCDAINQIWGGGVTLSNGAELYDPWPLPPMKAGDRVVYSATTSGSTNASNDRNSGAGFALYRNEGLAPPADVLLEEFATVGAELTLSGSHTLPADETGFIVYGWSNFAGATLHATVTCTPAPAAPSITGLTPGSGPTEGGTSVVIDGTDFTGVTDVTFGGVAAPGFTVNSATRITATAPANPAGAAPVAITNAQGTSNPSGAATYTYVQRPAAPVFTSAPPSATNASTAIFAFSLPAGASAVFSLDGSSFQPATSPLSFVALSDGTHTLSVKSVLSGLESSVTTYTWTVDTIVPAPPVVNPLAPGANRRPTFQGTAEISSTVSVFVDGVLAGVATSGGSGDWTLAMTGDLVDGQHMVQVTATDRAGNVSPLSPPVPFVTTSAPVASDLSVSIPYGVPNALIALGNQITGVHTSITVVNAPAHGALILADSLATYTPTVGYFGTDSFTYTATGPGGTSAVATVSLTVAAPGAPVAADVNGVAVAYDSAGQAIDLSASITGVHASIAIGTAPAHGTASVVGNVVTYTPTAGYFGADSFTYTATGPGGASAPATVSLTVATPTAPVAVNVSNVAVAHDSAGQAIDLSASITGVHASIAIGTAPAHGTASVSGDVVTYKPSAGYFGADSFTYTATGPGGTSAPATVSLTVAAPSAPVAANVSNVAVAHDSAGQTIDLSASITGVHASIAIGTAPAHGTASVSGDVVTYKPSAGYFGADSFTYTANGPGGTSAPATVSLTVAAPSAPDIDPPAPVVVQPTPGGSATIALPPATSGTVTGYRVDSAPAHGQAVIQAPGAGGTEWSVAYTPAPGFMGEDTIAVVAQGPGGESAPATMTFRVLGQAPDLQGTSQGGQDVVFEPTTSLTGGPFQGLVITRQPTSGTAQVDGLKIIYTPEANAAPAARRMAMRAAAVPAAGAPASMDYAVILPFGQSLPGTIEVQTVRAPTPVLAPLTATTLAGRPVTVSLTDTATGGPFVGATVVDVTDEAGTAILTEGGVAGNRTYDVTFTPEGDFTGTASVTYTLSNAGGPTTGVLTITVEARSDPSLDPEVRGLVSAQADTARRFARSQADNFHRRLEQVRRGGGAGVSNQMRLNLGDGGLNQDPREALRQQLGQSPSDRDDGFDRLPSTRMSADDAATRQADAGQSGQPAKGGLGVWTAGAIDWGRRDAQGQRDYRFSTSGVSAGVDMAVSDRWVAGVGLGYGHDRTKVGDNGTLSEADSYVGALYGSWRATDDLIVDGVLGYGSLSFDSRRWSSDAGEFAFGERSGSVLFGSASVALERSAPGLAWAPYARLQFGKVDLDGFTENGAGFFALKYDAMTVDTLAAGLGASFDWTVQRRSGVLTPSLRVEWRHEFEGADDQTVSYADWLASPEYRVGLEHWARDSLSLGLGVQWRALSGWSYGADYSGQAGSDLISHSLKLSLSKAF